MSEIKQANDSYLPSYLGFFFVASSVPDYITFCFVFSIIAIFVFFSRSVYFNPMYFLLGYRFYDIKTTEMVRILVVSKKNIRKAGDAVFEKTKRINDFTFIELDKDQ